MTSRICFRWAMVVFILAGCAGQGGFESLQISNEGKVLSAASTTGATISPPASDSSGRPAVPAPQVSIEPLIWESSSRPERKAWSDAARFYVAAFFADLDKAVDMKVFCPRYTSLTPELRINAWADLFAALAYYESGWDPKNNSVDVGVASNKNTYSVGLLQVSVVDQVNYGFKFGYTFADLQTAAKNLHLGTAIMGSQVRRKGKILIPTGQSGVYWATLHPGGRYDKTAAIAQMTKKLKACL